MSVCLSITVVSSDGVGIQKTVFDRDFFAHTILCQSIYFLAVYNFQLLHQSGTY